MTIDKPEGYGRLLTDLTEADVLRIGDALVTVKPHPRRKRGCAVMVVAPKEVKISKERGKAG